MALATLSCGEPAQQAATQNVGFNQCFVHLLLLQVDGQFVKLCKRLVLQFVILKPIIVILTLVLYSQGQYHDVNWSLNGWYGVTCYGALLSLSHALF